MKRAAWVIGLYGLLAVLVVPVFPHFQSPNELTRWAFAASLVERGTPEVSPVLPLLAPGFEDLSVIGGRTYSNKAPGAALAALPGYLLARPFVGPPSGNAMRPALTAMRLCGATLPAVLLAWLFASLSGRLGGETSRVPLALLALLFGTPLFAYGLLMFSHALVAFCLFGAWGALFLPGTPRAERWREAAAGALIGLAVLSEYPAIVPGLVLVGASAARRRPGRVLNVVAGGAPFALGLAVYNRLCFGGVMELSSAHEKYAQFSTLATSGLFGIGAPSLGPLGGLLVGPAKGLLVFSPILLVSLRAFAVAARVLPSDAFIALAAVPLSLVLLYGGYPNWHGGWTVGARYLVAALPFLVFPLVFRRGGRLEAVLLGASAAAVTITTLVFPFVPPEFPFPWGSFALPLLSRGLVAPNAFHLAGNVAVAAPFAIVAAALLVALPARRLALCAAGAAGWVALGLAAPRAIPLKLGVVAERAYIEDVHFERPGALERDLGGLPVPPTLRARRDAARALPP